MQLMCCLTLGIYPFGENQRSLVDLQDSVRDLESFHV